MNKKLLNKALGFLIPLLLTAAFLYAAFRNIDLNKVVADIKNVRLNYLALFVFLFLLSHIIRAIRWKYIIYSAKKDAKLIHLFGATMIGYGVNAVVPRLGEVYRAVFLGKWEGISRTSMFGTVIVERVIDILALAFSVLLSALFYSGNLYSQIYWLKSAVQLAFIFITATILLIIGLVIFKEKFSAIILKLVGTVSKKAAEKLNYLFSTLIEGFASLKGGWNYFVVIALTAVIMFLYGLNSYVGFFVLGMNEIQKVTFGMGWILMTISAFGVVIPTPGGLGSYHLIAISVLTLLFNFNPSISGAYAIVTHIVAYAIFVASPFFFVFWVNRLRATRGEETLNFITVFKSSARQEEL